MTKLIQFLSALQNEIEVTPKKVRDFGWVIFAVIGVIVPVFISWRNEWIITDLMLILFGIGLLVLIPCLIAPNLMRPVYRGWMTLAVLLGLFMTKVIITLVFYGMMTPIGLLRRLLVKDPMGLRINKEKQSYWVEKEHSPTPESYEKQY